MSAITTTLVIIGRHILIYGGFVLMSIGMFGSLMIMIIFNRKPLNENPCSIYLIANGILSFFFLPFYYLSTILSHAFQITDGTLSNILCKLKMSYGAFTVTSIFIINCLISFDRYAMSSRSVRIRSFSSKKITRILVFIGMISVCCLIGLPIFILFENLPTNGMDSVLCASKSRSLLVFISFFYIPMFEGVLPIVLAIAFWFVIRKQIHQLRNRYFIRRFDKQITRMYWMEILTNALASLPFSITSLYRKATIGNIRSEDHEQILTFFSLLSIWLFYLQYSCDFYIYLMTSRDIRIETKKVLCFWRRSD